jgi:orotate phosphoribosyltransferase
MDVKAGLNDRGCIFLNRGVQFIGTSGRHLEGYCNIDPVLPDVTFMRRLGNDLAEPFRELEVEAVLAPAIGAIPLAYVTASALMDMTGRRVDAAWADKLNPHGLGVERRGFRPAVEGKRTLKVDDIVNQGHTALQLGSAAYIAGAEVVGMSAVVANQGVTPQALGVSVFERLCEISYRAWDESDCQENGPCSEGWPIVIDESLGHGAAYQAQQPNYRGGYITLDT